MPGKSLAISQLRGDAQELAKPSLPLSQGVSMRRSCHPCRTLKSPKSATFDTPQTKKTPSEPANPAEISSRTVKGFIHGLNGRKQAQFKFSNESADVSSHG
jgi:hypothetical protein